MRKIKAEKPIYYVFKTWACLGLSIAISESPNKVLLSSDISFSSYFNEMLNI